MPSDKGAIDLQDSEGSSDDSYNSDEDSEGSLREFVVDVVEESDYEVSDTDATGSDATLSDTEVGPSAPLTRRARRAVRNNGPQYVLDTDSDLDSEYDPDYDPAAEADLVLHVEFPDPGQHLTGVQRFLAE